MVGRAEKTEKKRHLPKKRGTIQNLEIKAKEMDDWSKTKKLLPNKGEKQRFRSYLKMLSFRQQLKLLNCRSKATEASDCNFFFTV